MLFPIGDDDSTLTRPAYATWVILLANLFVFFVLQEAGFDAVFTYGYSVVPQEITMGVDLITPRTVEVDGEPVEIPHEPGPVPIYLTLLTSMFMHAGFLHLFGNMLYLWIFGDNVEHRFGSFTFLCFYFASGLVGTLAQIGIDPVGVVPSLGASGAISGVLGAYVVLFPRNRVHVIFFLFIIAVPAVLVIGLWVVFQFINGYGAVMVAEETAGGVAYGAHIGGFFAGVILALVIRLVVKSDPPNIFQKADPNAYVTRWR